MNIKILDDGREITLPTKTAAMVRVMVEVSLEIEQIPSGRLTLHFKGRSVIPELTRSYRPHKSEDATDKV